MTNIVSSRRCFIRNGETRSSLRIDYITALLPAVVWSFIRFGLSAFILCAAAVAGSILLEFVFRLLTLNKFVPPSAYAVYYGLFFALTLYPDTSPLAALLGGILSALLACFLGGEGKCVFFTPLCARAVVFNLIPDAVNAPDNIPSDILATGCMPDDGTFAFMLGTAPGAIGAVSCIALLLGAVYLFARRSASLVTATAYIASAAALFIIFPQIEGNGMEALSVELLSGGLLFCAVFAASDLTLAPVSGLWRMISGICLGVLTFILRRFGYPADAAFLAIPAANVLTVLFDRITLINITKSRGRQLKEKGTEK